jgi:hypothetical protein
MLAERLRLSGADRRGFAASESFDVAHGRLAEETAVLTAELAYAFVTDFVRRTRRINPIRQHPLSCRLQPELFLVLDRTHRGQCPKLMVERWTPMRTISVSSSMCTGLASLTLSHAIALAVL